MRVIRRLLTRGVFVLALLWGVAGIPGGCGSPRAPDRAVPSSVAVPVLDARAGAPAIEPAFSPERYLSHVSYLASDELGGRAIGTEGIRLATEYIAAQFQVIGLAPAGEDGTCFQTFTMKTGAQLTDKARLEIEGVDAQARLHEDYVPFPFSSPDEFEGEVVFAGYGIVNPDKNHDDYAHTDVTGKVVVVFRHEPPGWAEGDDEFTPHAQFSNKVYTARNRGAAALLVVNRRLPEGQPDTLFRFRADGETADYGLPAFHITRALAGNMLAAGGPGGLDELQDRLDQNVLCSAPLPGVRVRGSAGVERTEVQVQNVMGLLPGTGPSADEFVVIGAHHDHLGVQVPRRSFRSAEPSEPPEIHNGADDNASGTAGVIELARWFAAAAPPERSLVFMTFAAEESGLIGSQRFVSHPTVPLDKIAAMVNLDMIGRLPADKSEVQIYGTGSADEFPELVKRLADRRGLTVRTGARAVGPSDHTPFYTRGVPALHFFSGLHRDYHRPTDDADKINAEGACTILALVRDVVLEMADADTRLTYNKTEGKPAGRRSGYRVVMGIMPTFYDEDEVDGMEVEAVSEGGPAQAAGMRDHDRIVRIDGKPVNNIHDYMAALSGRNPGNTVQVVVVRNETEITLRIVLASGQ